MGQAKVRLVRRDPPQEPPPKRQKPTTPVPSPAQPTPPPPKKASKPKRIKSPIEIAAHEASQRYKIGLKKFRDKLNEEKWANPENYVDAVKLAQEMKTGVTGTERKKLGKWIDEYTQQKGEEAEDADKLEVPEDIRVWTGTNVIITFLVTKYRTLFTRDDDGVMQLATGGRTQSLPLATLEPEVEIEGASEKVPMWQIVLYYAFLSMDGLFDAFTRFYAALGNDGNARMTLDLSLLEEMKDAKYAGTYQLLMKQRGYIGFSGTLCRRFWSHSASTKSKPVNHRVGQIFEEEGFNFDEDVQAKATFKADIRFPPTFVPQVECFQNLFTHATDPAVGLNVNVFDAVSWEPILSLLDVFQIHLEAHTLIGEGKKLGKGAVDYKEFAHVVAGTVSADTVGMILTGYTWVAASALLPFMPLEAKDFDGGALPKGLASVAMLATFPPPRILPAPAPPAPRPHDSLPLKSSQVAKSAKAKLTKK